ncbi:Trehalose/maltose import ATP-binding protein MalK [Hyphomicrobiales bacterium]|nr:Trehalose/maltose import ATP-binding protein MalK [Hyphomicrobiales bacterium]CAH1672967.1 Trehalose/maltose import ATP-binding protein MalK [Hyphomicrobiales bacterium]
MNVHSQDIASRAVGASARSVRFVDVAKRFGSVTAVGDVNLTIAPGQFVTLLGPSGCGKSTTLSMIAGLELPSQGHIYIGDKDVTTVPPADRDIAMVFQSYALYPHLTIFENIAFPLRAKRRRTTETEVNRKVTDAARMLGLDKLLERFPREISGGQRQRVALGRAMVRTPTIYLLDEPLSNLDQQLRVQMRSELKDLHQRLGATMLYVTHDQGEAMTLSDIIAVMSAGRIEQVGAPRELYDRPANLFVARFLGEPGMNILNGDIGDGRLRAAGVAIALPPTVKAGPGGLCAGIRPEDLVLCPADEAELTGVVRTVEFLGSRCLMRADIGETLVTAFLPAEVTTQPGETVGLKASHPGRTRWFDVTSGLAVGQ